MYRFLVRPKWIAFTLLIAVALVAMLNLSAWQFHRLDERQAFNEAGHRATRRATRGPGRARRRSSRRARVAHGDGDRDVRRRGDRAGPDRRWVLPRHPVRDRRSHGLRPPRNDALLGDPAVRPGRRGTARGPLPIDPVGDRVGSGRCGVRRADVVDAG
ncbi:MAG: hypothetical protein R2705_17925 [Ilumatobacteraceae bacterium]